MELKDYSVGGYDPRFIASMSMDEIRAHVKDMDLHETAHFWALYNSAVVFMHSDDQQWVPPQKQENGGTTIRVVLSFLPTHVVAGPIDVSLPWRGYNGKGCFVWLGDFPQGVTLACDYRVEVVRENGTNEWVTLPRGAHLSFKNQSVFWEVTP